MGFYDPSRKGPDWASGISEGVGNFMQMEQMKKLMALLAQQRGGQGQPGEGYRDPGASTLPQMPQNMNTSSMPQGMGGGMTVNSGRPPMSAPQVGIGQTPMPSNRLAMSKDGGPSMLTPELLKQLLAMIMMRQGGGGMPGGMSGMPTR